MVNESGSGIQGCVYLAPDGVTTNFGKPDLLAWMVASANDGFQVKFEWQPNYCFVVAGTVGAVEFGSEDANLETNDSTVLSHNNFGFQLGTPQPGGPSGRLSIKQDGTIPTTGGTVAGIGLNNAGCYAHSVGPNLALEFAPVSPPAYRITFARGQYFEENRPFDVNPAHASAPIAFPPNVVVMTATLGRQHKWSVMQGAPASPQHAAVYRAGTGLIS